MLAPRDLRTYSRRTLTADGVVGIMAILGLIAYAWTDFAPWILTLLRSGVCK